MVAAEEQPKGTEHRCKERSIVATDAPRGQMQVQRVVFRNGFPRHLEDFGPSHHLSVILIASGTVSVAVIQPWIAAVRGEAAVRDLKVLNRGSGKKKERNKPLTKRVC